MEKARENQMIVTYEQFINNLSEDQKNNLSIDELFYIQSDIERQQEQISEAKKSVRDLVLKYCAEAGRQALRAAGKDTGATTLHANDYLDFKFEIPKKVEWDQPAMLAIVEDLASRGINVKEIVKITLAIEERKFNSLPQNIQALFLPARTVKDGEPKAVLIESKKER
jgi:hypothetical protein